MTPAPHEALPAKLAKYCRDQLRAAIGDDPTCVAQMIEQVVMELADVRMAEYEIADGRAFVEAWRVLRMRLRRERIEAEDEQTATRAGRAG